MADDCRRSSVSAQHRLVLDTAANLYVVAGVCGLVGLLYFVSCGHAWLAERYSPQGAGLLVGGVFCALDFVIYAFAELRSGNSSRGLATVAVATSAGTLVARSTVGGRAGGCRHAVGWQGARTAGKSSQQAMGRDLETEPLSTTEALSAVRHAVSRSAHQAAAGASSGWQRLESELRELPNIIQPALASLATMLAPRTQPAFGLSNDRACLCAQQPTLSTAAQAIVLVAPSSP